MSKAEQFHFSDFTRENYSRLLTLAKRSYAFRRYSDWKPEERFVIWRHDIDFSPQAAVKLAQREADAGVAATYFVWLHSDFYNLLERDVTDCVRTLARLGHDVGLHFDIDYAGVTEESALAPALTRERRILEDVLEQPISAFSFHNPDARTRAYGRSEYDGLLNAAADVFYSDVAFCSDSNGYWRDRRLEDVLTAASDARLQVLTHPEMWQDTAMAPRQRVMRCIDGRAQRTRERYERLLQVNHRNDIGED
jgi:hypothetical protein